MPLTGCCKISASSDGMKFLVFLLVTLAHPSLQWRVRCPKLAMQGGVFGKHAPANANTLITIRAAIIDSLRLPACLDEA